MNEPSVLWPWPWWTGAIAAAAIIAISWIAARAATVTRNRRTRMLAERLREEGLSPADAYAVTGDKNAIVVSDRRMAVVDSRGQRIVQRIELEDAAGLKIYGVAADTIPFRLMGRNGAQSRKVTTRSIVEFTRLFALLAGAGKRIEYIEE